MKVLWNQNQISILEREKNVLHTLLTCYTQKALVRFFVSSVEVFAVLNNICRELWIHLNYLTLWWLEWSKRKLIISLSGLGWLFIGLDLMK